MLDLIASYESGSLSASEMAEMLEKHESALEGISPATRLALRRAATAVVVEEASDAEKEMLGIRGNAEQVLELRALVGGLCDGGI